MKIEQFEKSILIVASALMLIGSFLQTGIANENPCDDSAANGSEPSTAVFAGGCFWCVESDFEHLPSDAAAASSNKADPKR